VQNTKGPCTLSKLVMLLGLHQLAISHLTLGGALLPLDVHNLGELQVSRVGGEETSGASV